GPFELETAIVRNVYLLVRVVDQKRVRADSELSEVGGGTKLVEVRGREARLIGPLDHATSVNAVDAAAVVGGQGEWHMMRWCERDGSFSLRAPRRLNAAVRRVHAICYVIAELVITDSPAQEKPPLQQTQVLL